VPSRPAMPSASCLSTASPDLRCRKRLARGIRTPARVSAAGQAGNEQCRQWRLAPMAPGRLGIHALPRRSMPRRGLREPMPTLGPSGLPARTLQVSAAGVAVRRCHARPPARPTERARRRRRPSDRARRTRRATAAAARRPSRPNRRIRPGSGVKPTKCRPGAASCPPATRGTPRGPSTPSFPTIPSRPQR
jgi:hypothetical protein